MSEQALSGLADAFNEALVEGRLTIQSCNDCGKPNMWPRYRCPFCQSADLGWKDADGMGTLVSYSIVRGVPPKGFEDELPYGLGVIKLDEGVQLLARLERDADGGFDGYECDAAVRFSPHPAEEMRERPVAWFRLDSGEGP
jgi:uncharacterized OB-fold protein